jgi:hypothetical protein
VVPRERPTGGPPRRRVYAAARPPAEAAWSPVRAPR